MHSHYKFNVSHNGKHVFATAEHSAFTREDADVLSSILHTKFPKSEGYEVSCIHWEVRGFPQSLTQ